MEFDIAVIGSGPAGLAAAYAALTAGKTCIVLEKQPLPGMKLLASGGGRCNVTNALDLEDFAAKFGRNWRFLLPALEKFHGRTLLDFFNTNHVPLTLSDGFHYFPASGKARDVLELFTKEIIRRHGTILTGIKVNKLVPGDIWQLSTDRGTYRAKQVVCACGGRGYPALGGSCAGYELVKSLGHTVTALYPAMTGVVCADLRIGEYAGLSIDDCIAEIAVKGKDRLSARGELLFTHRGFSAFAILDLAGKVAQLLDKNDSVPLKIDFLPQYTSAELQAEFAAWRKTGGTKHISTLLSKFLPRKLALLILDGDDPEISRWQSASSETLLQKLKGSVFQLSGVENWEKAMVTMGGVSLKEVSPHTLESKLFPGLFFAGEMLDVTGPCGGFNISWALASGMLAGSAAQK
ncbi:MAG: aminoacetone oxidase family FAD-binding enzyme [Lentisphaerae bacterium]|nr:aminoacetone oxidase family FAD-binding enzyme [Lentisphaerota bacterium]